MILRSGIFFYLTEACLNKGTAMQGEQIKVINNGYEFIF